MTIEWSSIIAAVIVALLANVGPIIAARAVRNRTDAEASRTRTDAAGVIVDKALAMAEKLECQVDELEAEIAKLRARIKALEPLEARVKALEKKLTRVLEENKLLRQGGRQLEIQVETLGHEPVWRVPGGDDAQATG